MQFANPSTYKWAASHFPVGVELCEFLIRHLQKEIHRIARPVDWASYTASNGYIHRDDGHHCMRNVAGVLCLVSQIRHFADAKLTASPRPIRTDPPFDLNYVAEADSKLALVIHGNPVAIRRDRARFWLDALNDAQNFVHNRIHSPSRFDSQTVG
jgi:hypothetical protein